MSAEAKRRRRQARPCGSGMLPADPSCWRCGSSLTHTVEAPRVPDLADMFCPHGGCPGPNAEPARVPLCDDARGAP